MKAYKEHNIIAKENEIQNKKAAELTDEDLLQIAGGLKENDEEKGFICGFFPGLSGFP